MSSAADPLAPPLSGSGLALASGAESATLALFVAGLGVAVLAAGFHLRYAGLDPFRRGIGRANRLTPAMALAPAAIYVLASMLLGPVQRWLAQGGGQFSAQQVQNTLAQLIGALACLYVAHQAFRGGVSGFVLGRRTHGQDVRATARVLLAAVGYFLAASALCELTYMGTYSLIRFLKPDYEFAEHRVIQALRRPDEPAWAPVALWIGAAVIAPLAEESFFRGLVQTLILNLVRIRGIAVLAAALVFAVAHSDQLHVLPAMTVFGMIVGLQYERSGGLLGPMVTHALFNMKTLALEWWTRPPAAWP